MGLGYEGETCDEAVKDSILPGEIPGYSELFDRVAAKGSWREATISRHLMSCVVNLPPARHEWRGRRPFSFFEAMDDMNDTIRRFIQASMSRRQRAY